DERLDLLLQLGPDVEEAGALRRAEPLVAIAGVDVRAEGLEPERNVARRVRTVDDRDGAGLARQAAELLDGQPQRGLRGYVADEENARPLGEALAERVERPPHIARARLPADVLPEEVERPVLVVAREYLVAR